MLRGHITICKVYSDGTEDTIVDRANLVTAGLGSSFIDIQRGQGSENVDGFSPYYFQVGTSSMDYDTTVATSSYFYQLSTPFSWDDYGDDTDFIVESKYRGFNASTDDGGSTYTELLFTSAALSSIAFSGTDEYFSKVKEGRLSKFFMDSFESEIVLDEKTGNGKEISEIGLFAKNPKGFKEDSPLLMAYRSFTPVTKTSEFSLVVHWSVGFLGISTNVDNHYTGV
tara:strand:+ start:460 stop:1137 length:678 start_codon:yes stop_codon:yes gene_type:complete